MLSSQNLKRQCFFHAGSETGFVDIFWRKKSFLELKQFFSLVLKAHLHVRFCRPILQSINNQAPLIVRRRNFEMEFCNLAI